MGKSKEVERNIALAKVKEAKRRGKLYKSIIPNKTIINVSSGPFRGEDYLVLSKTELVILCLELSSNLVDSA
jgi:hypothetical protein